MRGRGRGGAARGDESRGGGADLGQDGAGPGFPMACGGAFPWGGWVGGAGGRRYPGPQWADQNFGLRKSSWTWAKKYQVRW